MKKSLIVIGLLIIFIVLGIFLFQDFDSSSNTSNTLHDIIQLQQNEINSFDPLDAYHPGHVHVVKQLYNTLTDINENGETIPSLAENWDTEDGTVWTFNLRDDVNFINDESFETKSSKKLNAYDVLYTFERLLSPESESLGKAYFDEIAGVDEYQNNQADSINGIQVIDSTTVQFTLKSANFNFYKLLALPFSSIVPKEAVDFYQDQFKLNPVGTGPFELSEFVNGESLLFTANESYWEENNDQTLPLIDTLSISLYRDENFALSEFRSGNSDFLELSLPQFYQINEIRNPSFSLNSKPTATFQFYLFNLENISSANYRKAVNASIDRERLTEIIGELGTLATSIYPASIFPDLAPNESRLIVDQDSSEAWIDEGPDELTLICFDDLLSRNIAQFIQSSLSSHGIDISIESLPFSVLVDRLVNGNYDIIQLYWGPYYADIAHYLSPFLTSSFPPEGNNFNRYSTEKFDELVSISKTKEDATDEYLQAEEVILNDMPFIPLYFSNLVRASNNEFEMVLHPLQYRFYKSAESNE